MWNENKVRELLNKALGTELDTGNDINLMRCGINSLQIMKFMGLVRKEGKKVSFADLMENPTISSWLKLIEKSAETNKSRKKTKKIDNAKESFDMTDVQYAYWIGREDNQPMGGVDCHAYYEFQGENVDVDKLAYAWGKLFEYHPMLRTKFLPDGKQVTMNEAYTDSFHITDLSSIDEKDIKNKLLEIRSSLSHRKLKIEEGETCGLTHCILSGNKSITIIDVALIVCDVQSIKIMLRDLADIYDEDVVPDVNKDWNFGSYLEQVALERRDEEVEGKKYWKDAVETLPTRPELPLVESPEKVVKPEYIHHERVISEDAWANIRRKSAEMEVTPAMVLLTAYSKVINRWSSNNEFLINVPLFDRMEEYENVSNVIADFTTLLLAKQDYSQKRTFRDDVLITSEKFKTDVKHAVYGGVKVQRDLQNKYPGQRDFAPVVFACNIGMNLISERFEKCIGKILYMVSQTPQVWIDCQTFEMSGELHVVWDTANKLFPAGLPEDMFDTYVDYLNHLGSDECDWSNSTELRISNSQIRKSIDEVESEFPKKKLLLTEGLIRNASDNSEAIAVYDCRSNKRISYEELYETSMRMAAKLNEAGFKKGQLAAVILPRGIDQIIAIYGILLAGGCYVPISYDQPENRLNVICNSLGIGFIVTNSEDINITGDRKYISTTNLPENSNAFKPVNVEPSDSAYIIMTSGSTGTPKGVEIRHKSAMNTIVDINERNGIAGKDSVLGVSPIDFDLSVYDIFGMAYAGGTLYVIKEEQSKDAEAWSDIVKEHNITVWNTVPILFEMILTVVEQRNQTLPLKKVMLSGDWIPIELAKRLYGKLEHATLIAMGGATEASIWSNECVVPREIPEDWISIPYGKALRGQIYRIRDEQNNDCPDWVSGELQIGGVGVAKGYYGDPKLTDEKFSNDGRTTWYRTGDIGRFWSDGTIEFLGRKDYQVKIKGHRIELGEVEAAISSCELVKDVVAAIHDNNGSKSIAAFYTMFQEKDNYEEVIKDAVKDKVPYYMNPKFFIRLDTLPMTVNGKVDRKSLTVQEKSTESIESELNETGSKLKELWQDNLGISVSSGEDDYFELGGNSLKATKLLYEINNSFGIKFKIASVFRYSTLGEMAEYIDKLLLEEA